MWQVFYCRPAPVTLSASVYSRRLAFNRWSIERIAAVCTSSDRQHDDDHGAPHWIVDSPFKKMGFLF
jgi:hypothetical protein